MRFRIRRLLVLAVAATGLLLNPAAVPLASAATTTFTGSVDRDGGTPAPITSVHKYEVVAPTTITATLDWADSSANLTLVLKLPDGTKAASAATAKKPESLVFEASVSGTYKFNVIAASGGSAYTLGASTGSGSPPPPVEGPPVFDRTIGGPAHPTMAPSGLDVDTSGNLYIADTANDQIASYTPDGVQRWRVGERGTRANGNLSNPFPFSNPRDVAFAGDAIYVADTGYNRIQVLDAETGAWRATWSPRFGALMGISTGVDGSGAPIVLASDSTSQTVKTYTTGGVLLKTIGLGLGSGDGYFNQVRDAATDMKGNIYAADFKNGRVQVFSPSGTFLRKWGSICVGLCPDPQPGEFKEPYGIQLDDAGNVYVSDNRRVQKFNGTGVYAQSFGSRGTGVGQFEQLRRVAVARGASPAVYGADLWGYKVLQFTASGSLSKTFGNVPPAAGGFNEAYGLSVQDGTLRVVDTNNQRVQEFDAATGDFRSTWGHRGFGQDDLNGVNWPRAITYNAATSTIWLADTKNYRLTEHAPDGTPTGRVVGTTGSTLMPNVLNWAYGIASHGADIVVADTFGQRVTKWTGDDATRPLWTATGFSSPKGVTVAGDVVYVADSVNHRIVKLNANTGERLGEFGGNGVLHRVEGVVATPRGTVWVADTSYNRLVEFDASGAVLRTFGKAGTAPGQFNGPSELAIGTGAAGPELYVMDSLNDRVQVFTIS